MREPRDPLLRVVRTFRTFYVTATAAAAALLSRVKGVTKGHVRYLSIGNNAAAAKAERYVQFTMGTRC